MLALLEGTVFHAGNVGLDEEAGDVLPEAGAGVFGGNADFFDVAGEGIHGDKGVSGAAAGGGGAQEAGDALDFFADEVFGVVDLVGDFMALGGEGIEGVNELEAGAGGADAGEFGGRGRFVEGEGGGLQAGFVAEVGRGEAALEDHVVAEGGGNLDGGGQCRRRDEGDAMPQRSARSGRVVVVFLMGVMGWNFVVRGERDNAGNLFINMIQLRLLQFEYKRLPAGLDFQNP